MAELSSWTAALIVVAPPMVATMASIHQVFVRGSRQSPRGSGYLGLAGAVFLQVFSGTWLASALSSFDETGRPHREVEIAAIQYGLLMLGTVLIFLYLPAFVSRLGRWHRNRDKKEPTLSEE